MIPRPRGPKSTVGGEPQGRPTVNPPGPLGTAVVAMHLVLQGAQLPTPDRSRVVVGPVHTRILIHGFPTGSGAGGEPRLIGPTAGAHHPYTRPQNIGHVLCVSLAAGREGPWGDMVG